MGGVLSLQSAHALELEMVGWYSLARGGQRRGHDVLFFLAETNNPKARKQAIQVYRGASWVARGGQAWGRDVLLFLAGPKQYSPASNHANQVGTEGLAGLETGFQNVCKNHVRQQTSVLLKRVLHLKKSCRHGTLLFIWES